MRVCTLFVLIYFSLVLTGCKKETAYMPVKMPLPEGGPYQLVTYSGIPIRYEGLEFVDDKTHPFSKSVYVNGQAQFVLKDGAGIETIYGEYVYWSDRGELITDRRRLIKPHELFSVNGEPMQENTAMMLKMMLVSLQAKEKELL